MSNDHTMSSQVKDWLMTKQSGLTFEPSHIARAIHYTGSPKNITTALWRAAKVGAVIKAESPPGETSIYTLVSPDALSGWRVRRRPQSHTMVLSKANGAEEPPPPVANPASGTSDALGDVIYRATRLAVRDELRSIVTKIASDVLKSHKVIE